MPTFGYSTHILTTIHHSHSITAAISYQQTHTESEATLGKLLNVSQQEGRSWQELKIGGTRSYKALYR